MSRADSSARARWQRDAAGWLLLLEGDWRGAVARGLDAPAELRVLLQFVGEVLRALGAVLRGRGTLRWRQVLAQLDRVGPGSLPIVTLTVFLAGLLLAYMGGSQLDRIGATEYISQVVTVGIVREMAAMMTGIILAGRLGAAFAAGERHRQRSSNQPLARARRAGTAAVCLGTVKVGSERCSGSTRS